MRRCATLRSDATMSSMKPSSFEDDLRLRAGRSRPSRAGAGGRSESRTARASTRTSARAARYCSIVVRILVREDGVDGGVGHPRVAADHAVVHLVADDVAARRSLPSGRTAPGDRRAGSGCRARSRAPTGTCGRRAREIDRGAALVGFLVERAAFLHVVRDVGDVHAQPVVAVLQPLDRDRIVEVARVLAVDRDDRAIAEVGAAGDVLLLDGAADALRFGDRLRGCARPGCRACGG